MEFWYRVLLESPDVDENPGPEDRQEPVLEYAGPKTLELQLEVVHWLVRNSKMCDAAAAICREYFESQSEQAKNDWLPTHGGLAWNYTPREEWTHGPVDYEEAADFISKWEPEEVDKYERHRKYGRVSHELDVWWEATRIPNTKDSSLNMYPLDFVPERIKQCEANLMQRYAPPEQIEEQHEPAAKPASEGEQAPDGHPGWDTESRAQTQPGKDEQ